MGQEMKKLKWWQRALFCMNNDVRQTQYKDYVDRKHIHKKQWDLDARLRVVEKGKGASTQEESQEQDKSEDTFSFGKWNEGSSFDWNELAEDTSKGKEAIEEEYEEEDGEEDEEEDDDDDDDYDNGDDDDNDDDDEVEEEDMNEDDRDEVEELRSRSASEYSWNSDEDNFINIDVCEVEEVSSDSGSEYYGRHYEIMGFHPHKHVLILLLRSEVMAYHLDTSRMQYLGREYDLMNDHEQQARCVYGSFPYRPCYVDVLPTRNSTVPSYMKRLMDLL
jgi:hypothetical protein